MAIDSRAIALRYVLLAPLGLTWPGTWLIAEPWLEPLPRLGAPLPEGEIDTRAIALRYVQLAPLGLRQFERDIEIHPPIRLSG
ncbi:MAG TPA: hypothetical protein VK934_00410 [Fimbriimonas sp.]|nr:hypothetical protein [Fimbriimonas sp.]